MCCQFGYFFQGRFHGVHPGCSFCLADGEGHVALSQSGMAALVAVGVWAAESLDQKEGHALLCRAQVFGGIEGSKDWIDCDSLVKGVRQGAKGSFAANLVKYYCFIFIHIWNYTCGPAGVR